MFCGDPPTPDPPWCPLSPSHKDRWPHLRALLLGPVPWAAALCLYGTYFFPDLFHAT